MQVLTIKDDGTTAIEFTNAEAHELRDVLDSLKDSPVAWELYRRLCFAHGEKPELLTAEQAAERFDHTRSDLRRMSGRRWGE